jgi:hypothetical protein
LLALAITFAVDLDGHPAEAEFRAAALCNSFPIMRRHAAICNACRRLEIT